METLVYIAIGAIGSVRLLFMQVYASGFGFCIYGFIYGGRGTIARIVNIT